MDVLSDAVNALHTGRPHASRTRQPPGRPWGTRFRSERSSGFHVVLRGACRLTPEHGTPLSLETGDLAFLPRVPEYGIGHAPGASGPAETVRLCGAYHLEQGRPHPLLAELPEVIHLPARTVRDHPSLHAAIDLLARELGDSAPDRARPGASGAVPALLDVLLLYILRAWHEEQGAGAAHGWSAALRDPAVATALSAIHTDPAYPWTVQSLGARAGLS